MNAICNSDGQLVFKIDESSNVVEIVMNGPVTLIIRDNDGNVKLVKTQEPSQASL